MSDLTKIIAFDRSSAQDVCIGNDFVATHDNSNLSGNIKQFLKETLIKTAVCRSTVHADQLPQNPNCVLVATGGNLGGAIISLPLIQAARNRWPKAHLAVLGNTTHGLKIVEYAGVGDSFHLVPTVSLARVLFDKECHRFKQEILNLCPDIFIGNHDFRLEHVLPLKKIPFRIGHVGKSVSGDVLKDQRHFYTHQVICDAHTNWLRSYQDIANVFGVNTLDYPYIQVSPNEQQVALEIFNRLGVPSGHKVVGIQASVWQQQLFKAWPVQYLAQVCADIWFEHQIVPMIIGSAGQDTLCKTIRESYPEAFFIDCVGQTDLQLLPGVISFCDACVANDSGLMHLSAAVRTPIVALYGMTDPYNTWVYGDLSIARIIKREQCKPCYAMPNDVLNSCETRHCLTHISPTSVKENLLQVLEL